MDARNALDAEIRLYDNLFMAENPEDGDLLEGVNPQSLEVLEGCKVEAALQRMPEDTPFQFMRQGYFCFDKDSREGAWVLNRSVSLKDGFKRNKEKRQRYRKRIAVFCAGKTGNSL